MAAPVVAAPRPAVEAKDLSLKVMRLNKPTLYLAIEPRCEAQEMLGVDVDIEEQIGLGRSFSLPLQFGSIHTGETFASYISLCNISNVSLATVVLRVELQLPGGQTKHLLLDNTETPLTSFAPAASSDFVVRHVLKEPGGCRLVCTVSYIHPDGEKRFFRKFFQFPVAPPFEITLACRPLGADSIAEIQLRNITATSSCPNSFHVAALFVESIKLDSSAGAFIATEISISAPECVVSTSVPGAPPIEDLLVLKPGSARQLAFRLRQKTGEARSATFIGAVTVTWRSALGEFAQWTSDPLERKVVSKEEVELIVKRVPPAVRIEEPFLVEIELVNRSDRSVNGRLQVPATRNAGVQAHGIVSQIISLPPQGTKAVQLSLFAVRAGLHRVPLLVQDSTAERRYEFVNTLTVNVAVSV